MAQSLALPVRANLALDYHSILQLLIAGGDAVGVSPQFQRQVLTVAAGGTASYTLAAPVGTDQLLVDRHTITADPSSAEVVVTVAVDALQPTLTNVPLNEPVNIAGGYVPVIRHQAVYTLANNGSTQATVTLDFDTVTIGVPDYERIQGILKSLLQLFYQEAPAIAALQRQGVQG